ncbi:Sperm-Associated Antigen 1 [Manis pentadactyla]|nr:Sperm-Associated Antigen 1 [Manis pentadactyla]
MVARAHGALSAPLLSVSPALLPAPEADLGALDLGLSPVASPMKTSPGFKNYQKSLSDLHKVLLLDSSIVEAKMELEEVTRFLNIKDNTASLSEDKERRKIELQEVSADDEEEPERTSEEVSTDGLASEEEDPSDAPPDHYEKLLITKPNNAHEFGQVINALSTRKIKKPVLTF